MFSKLRVAVLAVFLLVPMVSTRADIIDLLPDESLFILRVTGLEENWSSLKESPIIARLLAEGPPEWRIRRREAEARIRQFEETANFKLEETIVGLLGHDAVIANTDFQGSVLVAVKPDLHRLVPSVNTFIRLLTTLGPVQQRDDEFFMGVTIRTLGFPNAPRAAWYYCIVDDTFVGSRQLHLVKDVISRKKEVKAEAPETEIRKAFEATSPQAVLRLYVDTDRVGGMLNFAETFGGRVQSEAMRRLLQHFDTLLPITDNVMLSVTPSEDGLELRQTIAVDEDQLPETLKALVPTETSFELLKLAPPSTVMVAAGNIDKVALWKHVCKVLADTDANAAQNLEFRANLFAGMLGSPNMEVLLSKLGGETTLIATADNNPAIPGLTLVSVLTDGDNIPVAIRSLAGLATGALQFRARQDGTEPAVRLETTTHRNVQLTTARLADRRFAGALHPTFFTMRDMMIISTSLEAAKAVIDAYDPEKEIELPEVEGILTLTGMIDLFAISELFDQHKSLIPQTERMNAADIENLSLLLSVFDNLQFYATYDSGRIERVAIIRFLE